MMPDRKAQLQVMLVLEVLGAHLQLLVTKQQVLFREHDYVQMVARSLVQLLETSEY